MEKLTRRDRSRLKDYTAETNETLTDFLNSDKTSGQVFQEYFQTTLGKYKKPKTARTSWKPKEGERNG